MSTVVPDWTLAYRQCGSTIPVSHHSSYDTRATHLPLQLRLLLLRRLILVLERAPRTRDLLHIHFVDLALDLDNLLLHLPHADVLAQGGLRRAALVDLLVDLFDDAALCFDALGELVDLDLALLDSVVALVQDALALFFYVAASLVKQMEEVVRIEAYRSTALLMLFSLSLSRLNARVCSEAVSMMARSSARIVSHCALSASMGP